MLTGEKILAGVGKSVIFSRVRNGLRVFGISAGCFFLASCGTEALPPSRELPNNPTPASEGEFILVHPAPIFQDITRTAFLYQSAQGQISIHFSTLESYHRNPDGDRFLWVSYKPASGLLASHTVEGSIEARCYGYSETLKRYVLGTSLNPQIFLYDPENDTINVAYRGPTSTAYIHRLAVRDTYAYTILSNIAGYDVAGFRGILQVDLATGTSEEIPFSDQMQQGWGGVQTVDPTGRVWFYRAFPFRQMWYDDRQGMRDRTLAGYESWTVESWDIWEGHTYVLLTNTQGEFVKKQIHLSTLQVIESPLGPVSSDTRLFLESIPVDLYHSSDPSLEGMYFHPATFSFYKRDPAAHAFVFLGSANLGDFYVMGFRQSPQEASLNWIHPQLGEISVMGALRDQGLVIWLQGRKAYGIVNFVTGSLALHGINVSNLSPADITSLVLGSDGFLYGGGGLTMSDMFRFNPTTHESSLLPGAIPNAEGQINSMFTGLDAKIYGAGYPDSVLFRFDPMAPWNPGQEAANNPLNLGPMGHHRQTRAYRGVQDLDGNIWYQSVTDYEVPIAHALAKADFVNRTLTVKTDLDDSFPQAIDLAVVDGEHLILLGEDSEQPGLYLLNLREFRIERKHNLAKAGGVIVNLDPHDQSLSRLLLAQEADLYRIRPDLSLQLVHQSPKPIVRIVAGAGEDIILVGKTHSRG